MNGFLHGKILFGQGTFCSAPHIIQKKERTNHNKKKYGGNGRNGKRSYRPWKRNVFIESLPLDIHCQLKHDIMDESLQFVSLYFHDFSVCLPPNQLPIIDSQLCDRKKFVKVILSYYLLYYEKRNEIIEMNLHEIMTRMNENKKKEMNIYLFCTNKKNVVYLYVFFVNNSIGMEQGCCSFLLTLIRSSVTISSDLPWISEPPMTLYTDLDNRLKTIWKI